MDELIKQAQDGDAEALGALWERTRKFAFTVSRRFRATVSVDADDLQQCAWLGFYAAVQKHTGKYNFLTLIDFCVRIECQQAVGIRSQKQRRAVQTVSYDVPAPDGEQSMLDLFEDTSLSESDTAMIGADLARDVRAAVAELPERERTIIELRWLSGEQQSLHAISKSVGISRERIRQLEERAFARLRDDPVLRSYIAAPPPIPITRSQPLSFMTPCRRWISVLQHSPLNVTNCMAVSVFAKLSSIRAPLRFWPPALIRTKAFLP